MTFVNARHLYALGLSRPVVEELIQLTRNADAATAAAAAAQTTANTGVTNAATAQTAADTAQTQADYSGYQGIGDSAVFKTDASGTQPANNTTRDLVAQFLDEDGTGIATRTLRGTYTTAADTIAVTAQSTTGEATTYSLNNDGTDAPSAIVVHTASEAIGVLTWAFTDLTTAGVEPGTGGGK